MPSIFDIKPTVISRDLKGKYVLLYGKPKSGKTTAACQFPHNLLCAFERGYNVIGGINALDVPTWAEFKKNVQELELIYRKRQKALAANDLEALKQLPQYDTVTIDTISIAWEECEKYICARHGVQKISDIKWGGGYKELKQEFSQTLRKITQLDYGIVLIAHSSSHIEKAADGSDIEIIGPELPKRAAEICNGIVDIIGYIGNTYENGEVQRWLYTRETPTLFAGSRFKYLAPKIPFGYQNLVDAIGEAIDKVEAEGVKVVDKAETLYVPKELNFNEIKEEAEAFWNEHVIKVSKTDQETAKANMDAILKKIEIVFGKKIKLSDITEDQVELYDVALGEMKSLFE